MGHVGNSGSDFVLMSGESSAASQFHHVYRTPAAPRTPSRLPPSVLPTAELVVGIGVEADIGVHPHAHATAQLQARGLLQ